MVTPLMMKYCTRGLILNDNVLSRYPRRCKDSVTMIALMVIFILYSFLEFVFIYKVDFNVGWCFGNLPPMTSEVRLLSSEVRCE